nr:hypothetical protein [Tanacetum cinerariifolium]
MFNKDNYVSWSSRLLRYAKSKPNGKLIYNSIINGPYVRRMIPESGDLDSEVPVAETIHEQTNDELTKKEVNQIEADDQAIQIILIGSDIGIQDKKAKLFNEWKRFTSMDEESIKSYYHRFTKLMNDFRRNKHFPEKIASTLNFLNNLQPEWRRHVTIVHQTKNLHKNGLIVVPRIANQNLNPNGNGNIVAAWAKDNAIVNNDNQIRCYNYRGLGYLARNCIVRPRKRDVAFLQTQLLIAQKEQTEI